jgi:hypothetical protein
MARQVQVSVIVSVAGAPLVRRSKRKRTRSTEGGAETTFPPMVDLGGEAEETESPAPAFERAVSGETAFTVSRALPTVLVARLAAVRSVTPSALAVAGIASGPSVPTPAVQPESSEERILFETSSAETRHPEIGTDGVIREPPFLPGAAPPSTESGGLPGADFAVSRVVPSMLAISGTVFDMVLPMAATVASVAGTQGDSWASITPASASQETRRTPERELSGVRTPARAETTGSPAILSQQSRPMETSTEFRSTGTGLLSTLNSRAYELSRTLIGVNRSVGGREGASAATVVPQPSAVYRGSGITQGTNEPLPSSPLPAAGVSPPGPGGRSVPAVAGLTRADASGSGMVGGYAAKPAATSATEPGVTPVGRAETRYVEESGTYAVPLGALAVLDSDAFLAAANLSLKAQSLASTPRAAPTPAGRSGAPQRGPLPAGSPALEPSEGTWGMGLASAVTRAVGSLGLGPVPSVPSSRPSIGAGQGSVPTLSAGELQQESLRPEALPVEIEASEPSDLSLRLNNPDAATGPGAGLQRSTLDRAGIGSTSTEPSERDTGTQFDVDVPTELTKIPSPTEESPAAGGLRPGTAPEQALPRRAMERAVSNVSLADSVGRDQGARDLTGRSDVTLDKELTSASLSPGALESAVGAVDSATAPLAESNEINPVEAGSTQSMVAGEAASRPLGGEGAASSLRDSFSAPRFGGISGDLGFGPRWFEAVTGAIGVGRSVMDLLLWHDQTARAIRTETDAVSNPEERYSGARWAQEETASQGSSAGDEGLRGPSEVPSTAQGPEMPEQTRFQSLPPQPWREAATLLSRVVSMALADESTAFTNPVAPPGLRASASKTAFTRMTAQSARTDGVGPGALGSAARLLGIVFTSSSAVVRTGRVTPEPSQYPSPPSIVSTLTSSRSAEQRRALAASSKVGPMHETQPEENALLHLQLAVAGHSVFVSRATEFARKVILGSLILSSGGSSFVQTQQPSLLPAKAGKAGIGTTLSQPAPQSGAAAVVRDEGRLSGLQSEGASLQTQVESFASRAIKSALPIAILLPSVALGRQIAPPSVSQALMKARLQRTPPSPMKVQEPKVAHEPMEPAEGEPEEAGLRMASEGEQAQSALSEQEAEGEKDLQELRKMIEKIIQEELRRNGFQV